MNLGFVISIMRQTIEILLMYYKGQAVPLAIRYFTNILQGPSAAAPLVEADLQKTAKRQCVTNVLKLHDTNAGVHGVLTVLRHFSRS